jgi:ferredoxin
VTEAIYNRLAHHLDSLPGGFPPTGSGVEIRILKKFFTPREAEFAPYLTLIPEKSRVVARRAGVSVPLAEQRLETMSQKGLIYRIDSEPGNPLYMAAQFALGIYEFHVNDLDSGLVKDLEAYAPVFFQEAWTRPQLRTIPVEASLNANLTVMTYENAEILIRDTEKAAVAACICRREQDIMGKGCDKPGENCLLFNSAADHWIRNGWGREIDQPQVLQILKESDEAGLVLQPTNAREILNICCCCGCCCGVLRMVKRHPQPVGLISTPFYAVNSVAACTGCGVCEDRCQMEAIHMADEIASIDTDRCIGCGLCVSTCPAESLALARKPSSDQMKVPKDLIQMFVDLGRARGKLSAGNILKMQVKSKLDRFLAARW